jgi:glutamate-1-semialdehyde 2,1-aminomutase
LGLNGRPKVTWPEREQIAARNRDVLDRELREKRLVFESRPYEAHVQFSNFCNMSCIMCWDGNNPPLKKMSPVVLERLRTQVAPDLSLITPHDGSEPTVVTWEETVALAKDYSVQLELVTNAQHFDEAKFNEIKDHIEMLVISIDSHVPEVFEKIRPGATADVVYRNLETAARLCREHRIEFIVQAVFMTLNAPLMPDMLAWMADHGVGVVNIVQMIDVNRRSWHLDPTMHFSAEYLDWIKKQCVATAEDRKLCLGWYLSGHEWFDFRAPEDRVPPCETKIQNDVRDSFMKLRHPGFCKYAYDRLRISADGHVSPCGLDGDRELGLGTLAEQSFDEIWNGPTARDLRRAHYTWDYPPLCSTCRYVDRVPVQESLEFLDAYLEQFGRVRRDVEGELAIDAPEHMLRTVDAPTITLRSARGPVGPYRLLLSPGGVPDEVIEADFAAVESADGSVELEVPEELWNELETNIGYWWAVLAFGGGSRPVVRTDGVRCLIRHEALPRIPESALKYADGGHFSHLYLGGNRELGWDERGELPDRPPLRDRGESPEPGKRFAKRRRTPVAAAPGRMGPEAYREMVGHVVRMVSKAVPEGAVAIVATKGDDALLATEDRTMRHFPAEGETYVGHHPPDDDWAIDRLEQARVAGAEFLVIPASMRWWLDHYTGFSEHLRDRYETLAEDRERCTIFDLRVSAEAVELPGSSAELAELADRALGYGGQHRMAFRRFYDGEEDVFPRFARDAHGYTIVDPEGREYVDWICGGGPVILGYRHPAVTAAIAAQLPVGPTLTLTHPLEVEVAELLRAMVPCAEMVTFGKNGSDAVTAAVRLARAVTGRELILQYGGHGFHDWYVALHETPGVPRSLRGLVWSFPYNDLDALEELLDAHEGEVAALVMEPVNVELPKPGYLEGVRELAHRHGALLVFDEVITALRLGNGGAQERFGVVPDLACLGKGLGNGMPLSALVGRREHMRRLPEVAYGMTFRGETLSFAAARAVLHELRARPVGEHLAEIGAQVRASFDRVCGAAGVRASLLGPEARMTFAWGNNTAVPPERLESLFILECARQGVLTNGNILPSLAHDDEAVQRTEAAFRAAVERVAEHIRLGSAVLATAIRAGFERCGNAGTAAQAPAAYLDAVRDEGTKLDVRGWILPDGEGSPCTVEAHGAHGAVVEADRDTRPDVEQAFPDAASAKHAGFALALDAERFRAGDRWSFELRARRGDRVLFSCPISRAARTWQAPSLDPARIDDAGVLHL